MISFWMTPPSCLLSFLLLDSKGEGNRLAVEKERVRTVIDVLAAEVPNVQAHRAFEVLKANVGCDEVQLDTVGGRNLWIKVQVLEPARELRFTHAAVTQDEKLQFGVEGLPGS